MSLGEEELDVLMKILVENIGEANKDPSMEVKSQVTTGTLSPRSCSWFHGHKCDLSLSRLTPNPVLKIGKTRSKPLVSKIRRVLTCSTAGLRAE